MIDHLFSLKNTFKYIHCTQENTSLIHIGYGIDNNYVRCTAASIASICLNNPKRYFSFYIITNGISNNNLDKFNRLASIYSINIIIFEIDGTCLKNLPTKSYLPLATYFRFILPMLLDNIDKLFYIDADIICLKSADELFDVDLKDNIIAAVPDLEWLGKKRTRALNLQDHIYFNAGLLAINMKKWLASDILSKVINCITKEPAKFQYLDQDALNLILTGKIFYLSRKFNYIYNNGSISKDIIFFHFAAHPKPWAISYSLCDREKLFANIAPYQYYEDKTPWKNTLPDLPSNYKEMEFYSKCLKKKKRYKESFHWYLKYLIAKFKYLTKTK